MGGSYQFHTCLREFSRSDSLRRHLESCICKQNEDDEQSEDDPSDNSESQQDDEDEISSDEEDEVPQSQSEIRRSSPWDTLMQQAYDSLQYIFDKTCETYYGQNPGMEIAEAEKKTFDELKSNYRQALISNYHDLIKMGKLLKIGPIHKQIVATAQSYDLKRITI